MDADLRSMEGLRRRPGREQVGHVPHRPTLKHTHLTEAFVDRARLPKTGEIFYRDSTIRGFALRVGWGGTKSFVLETKVKGRTRRIALGRWPVLGVVKARLRALEAKAVIADGGDPSIREGPDDLTFKAMADRYVEHLRAHDKRTWTRAKARIEAHFKRWHTRRVGDIAHNEVVKAHEEIGDEHGKVAANRAITLLRAMFNFAIDLKVFKGENPAVRVELFKEKKRERFLRPDELVRVNEALLQESDPYWRGYFPLVCMLGTRRMELLTAKWSDVDLTARTLKLPETKNGRSHLLPLPELAVAILEKLPSCGTSEWVFPGRGATGHLVEVKSAWSRIRERAKVEDVTVHDLRRTLGSWLAAAGHGLPMIGRALNHASPSSTAIYARVALDPVRVMLEANAMIMFGGGK